MHQKAVRKLGLLVAAAALAGATLPAAASAALTPDPASLDFGTADFHPQNQNGQQRSVQLTNDNATDVAVQSVTVAGADPSAFTVQNDGCTGQTLGPGGGCSVTLRFTPSALGALTAQLEVTDDTGTPASVVPLSGTGITGTIAVNPNPLTFTEQPFYFGGQNRSLQLSVGPNAGVQTTSAVIAGPEASAFYLDDGGNCFSRFWYPGSTCGFNIGFQPAGPGTYAAQLEIVSDGVPTSLVVPLSAVVRNGPRLVFAPTRLAFGDVPVGQTRALTITARNEGDYPTQVGETLTVTGLPDVFSVTSDTCEGVIVPPRRACTVTVAFRPSFAGPVDATLFLIAGDQRRPVEIVPVSGTGVGGPVPPPTPAARLSGRAVADSALTCVPSAPASTFAWLRNGTVVPGATGARLTPTDGAVGARFACRATIGAVTVTSAPSAPVRPRDLSRLRGAFVDAGVCRSASMPGSLQVGGQSVRITRGRPVTPRAPLVLRAGSRLAVTIDGQTVASGRRVTLSPRTLSGFGNGGHRLRVTAGGSAATATLGLATCNLALELTGGPGRSSVVAASARYGVPSVAIGLSGLRLRVAERYLGQLVYERAGLPRRTIELVGARSSANGVTVALSRGRIRVTGLPPEVGVVRARLRAGVVTGSAGVGVATATLRGTTGPARATAPAAWTP
jgi:Abnormal spindle-like microcephaly-assoc'd, ASPM-SPD-2-Hydin